MEARIAAYVPDERYRDDAFGLVVVKDAIVSLKAGSGGIGACLVGGKTGEVVERGRNRQYSPHFRSDMHAEMDLLNRYEDRLQKKGGGNSGNNPRQCGDLILLTSTEPCPMCLAAIYWARLDALYFAASRDDAADASFDDALLYEEVSKDWKSRSLKAEQHLHSEAQAVFKAWKNKSDRIDY